METAIPLRTEIPAGSRGDPQRLLRLLQDMGLTGINRFYEASEILYVGGTGGEALHLLLKGVLRLVRTYSGGKEATLSLLGAGDAFGCPVSLGHSAPEIYAEAFTTCEVIKVPRPLLDGAVRRNPSLAAEVTALKDYQLAAYEKLIGRLLSRRTPARLADLLLELVQKFGMGTHAETYPRTIGLRLTHEELGAMVASTRESISAAMAELRRVGAVAIEGGLIVILEPNLLQRMAEECG
jgi:CRP-like cAMP-binding protein